MTRTSHDPGTLLVCDVGGVLLTDGLSLLLDELAAAAGRDPAQLRAFFDEHQRTALFGGQGWAETTFWAELVSVAGPVEQVGSPGAWRARLRTLLRPLEPGTSVVKRWAATGPVWLVSNHRRAWLEPPLRASGVWQRCERRFVSEEVGIVKPDPANVPNGAGRLGRTARPGRVRRRRPRQRRSGPRRRPAGDPRRRGGAVDDPVRLPGPDRRLSPARCAGRALPARVGGGARPIARTEPDRSGGPPSAPARSGSSGLTAAASQRTDVDLCVVLRCASEWGVTHRT